ncbi:MAG: hypothetical protein AAF458_14180 [Pseudomonadota bacterium]
MTFTIPLYISLIPLVVGLVMLAVGVVLFRKLHALIGGITCLAALVFLVLIGPLLLFDRVDLTPAGVTQRTGFWFAPTVKGFETAGLDRIRITTDRDRNGRTFEKWMGEYASGETRAVDPGDLWEVNGDAIAEFLRSQEVEVVREIKSR